MARACRKAALATCLGDGSPYASLVTVAFDHDLSPILLLSRLSDHTRNLAADPRASLLLDGTEGLANPQTGPRVTLVGRAAEDAEPRLAGRFLARHPAAAQYAGFGDFAFWRVTVARAHFVGGFARAVWFDHPVGLDPAAAAAMAADEPGILAHMNADHAHAVDRLALLAGAAGAGWAMTAIDPDGCELRRGEDEVARLAFDRFADGRQAAREILVELSGRPAG